MITKKFRITVALLSLAAIGSVAASAGPLFGKAELQQNKKPPLPTQKNAPAPRNVPKIPGPTYLTCSFSELNLKQMKGKLSIINDTKSPIPKGTTIYWKLGDANKGSFILENGLTPSRSYSSEIELIYIVASSVRPMAWYYK